MLASFARMVLTMGGGTSPVPSLYFAKHALYAGTREVPEGAENCLLDMTFVVTGEMETLDRNQITEIIKRYGGKYVGRRVC